MTLLILPLMLLASRSLQPVSITTNTLPNGKVETSYSAVIDAHDGCTPYKWALVSGSLPKGVKAVPSISTTSLGLSGTPTTAGSYSFKISVTGCGGHVSEEAYEVTIQSGNNHIVDLNWKASTSKNVAGYNIYRGLSNSTSEKINPGLVASTLYEDSTVVNGNTYYYAVTTVNIEGEESAKTPALKVVVP
jgi:type 1 fimbria pilin